MTVMLQFVAKVFCNASSKNVIEELDAEPVMRLKVYHVF
jgi:hypothetical protein